VGVGLDELRWSWGGGGGFNGFRGLGVWSVVRVNVEYKTCKCKIV